VSGPWVTSLLKGLIASFLLCQNLQANPFALSWPTPNPSFAKGLGYHTFLQKTGPGKDFSSGSFGCVRNNGYKFHEGLDLFPIRTNGQGYAEDSVFAAMYGTVVHISHSATASAYGKYVVLEHDNFEPVLYTLYAHLAEISNSLKIGLKVKAAAPLGKMGNSASFHIPLNRSHLHFEVGFRLSNQFNKWYNRQNFKTKNKHGNFNGYNLVGFDPIDFYSNYQKTSFSSPLQYVESLPIVTKVRVAASVTPFIVHQNKSLHSNIKNSLPLRSWVCSFGPFGIPLLFEASNLQATQKIQVLSYNEQADSNSCRKLISKENGLLKPSNQLEVYLELIFLE
jgi:peptidoglycan LD-endopeptidase LytH